MQIEDRFYKSTEVAEILGVSLRTLYRYMDSEKIDSVQLPSGRHRFTKKQIESFLYKNSSSSNISGSTTNTNINVGGEQEQSSQSAAPSTTAQPAAPASAPEVSQKTEETPVKTETTEESDDDELERELEALLESLEEDEEDEETEEEDLNETLEELNKEVEDSKPDVSTKSASSILSDDQQQEQVEQQAIDENEVHYFYCPYNELRAIARIIKKTAEENDKKYAFTMNAGLSLFFPLDPFSVIHFYIRKEDLDFWKRNLQLKEVSKADANLGVFYTNGDAFNNTQEVSGLKVVSKERLIENLKGNNRDDLVQKAEKELSS